jgi:flagellar biosynthetic protein FliR
MLPLCREQLPAFSGDTPVTLQFVLMLSELAIGLLIGLLARVFFAALHFSLMFIATLIGFPGGSNASVLDGEPSSPLADALALTAVVAFFSTDGHVELLRTLLQSFTTLPVTNLFDTGFAVNEIARLLGLAFRLGMQLAAPFIVYSLAVNFLLGVAGRMAPQLPMQYVGGPIVLFGGIFLFGLLALPLMSQFMSGFGRWLAAG